MASVKFSIFAMHFVLHAAFAQNITESREGWQLDGNARSSWDILWSSLATIFACTWTVLHLNTPGPTDSDKRVLVRRIKWFIVAVLAPELIITIAFAQFLEARRSVAAFVKCKTSPTVHTSHNNEVSRQSLPRKEAIVQQPQRNPFEGPWTLAHGYLSTMGALVVQTDNGEYSVLHEDDPLKLLTSGLAKFPRIRKKDIKDRSKADSFAKGFALVQSGWLLINIIGRAAYKLPISPIEFITLAYVVCAFIIYGFWWSKPKDIVVPMVIDLSFPAETNGAKKPKLEDYIRTVSSRRENFDDTPDNTLVTGAAAVLAVIYCGIHIGAWNFAFATRGEEIAWRVLSVGSTAAPIVALLCPLLLLAEGKNTWWSGLCMTLYFILYMGLVLIYILARLGLLVLAFMAMRSLPVECYDTIDWLHSLPHF